MRLRFGIQRHVVVAKMLIFAACFTISACDDGEEKDKDGPPAAPSMLNVSVVDGGAHLVWKDNSSDEAHFMLFRDVGGEAVSTSPYAFPKTNDTSYHDGAVEAGKTYTYKIQSMNAAGEGSAFSNPVIFVLP